MFLIFIFFYLLSRDSLYPFDQFFFNSFFLSLPVGYMLDINKLFFWGEEGEGEGEVGRERWGGGGGEGEVGRGRWGGRFMKNKQICVIQFIVVSCLTE